MKTRIVWTKIWKDDWFQSLSEQGQKLFLYLITNENINISGFYQVSDFQIKNEARIKNLEKAKEELFPKAKFLRDWVYIKNANFYGGYSGDKNKTAGDNEIASIPSDVKKTLLTDNTDRVSIGYGKGMHTPINHKSVIINKYSKIEDVKEEDFLDISKKYQVPLSFVKSKLDDLINWHEKNPQKNYYKNYLSALRDWVKRDALNIKNDYAKRSSDVAI